MAQSQSPQMSNEEKAGFAYNEANRASSYFYKSAYDFAYNKEFNAAIKAGATFDEAQQAGDEAGQAAADSGWTGAAHTYMPYIGVGLSAYDIMHNGVHAGNAAAMVAGLAGLGAFGAADPYVGPAALAAMAGSYIHGKIHARHLRRADKRLYYQDSELTPVYIDTDTSPNVQGITKKPEGWIYLVLKNPNEPRKFTGGGNSRQPVTGNHLLYRYNPKTNQLQVQDYDRTSILSGEPGHFSTDDFKNWYRSPSTTELLNSEDYYNKIKNGTITQKIKVGDSVYTIKTSPHGTGLYQGDKKIANLVPLDSDSKTWKKYNDKERGLSAITEHHHEGASVWDTGWSGDYWIKSLPKTTHSWDHGKILGQIHSDGTVSFYHSKKTATWTPVTDGDNLWKGPGLMPDSSCVTAHSGREGYELGTPQLKKEYYNSMDQYKGSDLSAGMQVPPEEQGLFPGPDGNYYPTQEDATGPGHSADYYYSKQEWHDIKPEDLYIGANKDGTKQLVLNPTQMQASIYNDALVPLGYAPAIKEGGAWKKVTVGGQPYLTDGSYLADPATGRLIGGINPDTGEAHSFGISHSQSYKNDWSKAKEDPTWDSIGTIDNWDQTKPNIISDTGASQGTSNADINTLLPGQGDQAPAPDQTSLTPDQAPDKPQPQIDTTLSGQVTPDSSINGNSGIQPQQTPDSTITNPVNSNVQPQGPTSNPAPQPGITPPTSPVQPQPQPGEFSPTNILGGVPGNYTGPSLSGQIAPNSPVNGNNPQPSQDTSYNYNNQPVYFNPNNNQTGFSPINILGGVPGNYAGPTLSDIGNM